LKGFLVGTTSVSVVDVARHAGVSLGTVSNVLNRPERVSPATRDRVLAAIDDLGFVRNEAARQLRAGRSRTIGLVVLDIGNPFFTDLAAGVETAAAATGLSVVLCNSGESTSREEHYLNLLQEQRSYGVLITPVSTKMTRLDDIRRQGTPSVLVDRVGSGRRCSVSVDDIIGGHLAAGHLFDTGHKRIAFIGGPATLNQVADRLTGARRAAEQAGLPEDSIVVIETPALKVAEGRTAGARIAELPRTRRPTAAFCANDLLALGLLQEMTRLRVQVPGDLAIIGYDDIDFAAAAAVPLTSVRQPRSQLGDAAAKLLIDEVENATAHNHRQVVFAPELVIRDSTVSPSPDA
jgi:LacI family transcriptional regulator